MVLEAGNYGTALQAASFRGKREIIELLLDNEADVNAQGENLSHETTHH